MKTEKKFFLDKNDDLDRAVHQLIGAKSHVVVLNIPRDSVLASSVNNFHVLKRESATAEKELCIESVDERILELAGLAKIKAFNPVFKQRERVISDILPKPRFERVSKNIREEGEKEVPDEEVGEAEDDDEEEESFEPENVIPPAEARRAFRKTKRRRLARTALSFGVFVLVVLGGFFVASRVLPKATVEMILKKVPVTFAYEVEATSGHQAAVVSGQNMRLPAELLKAKGNLSLNFPASGKEKVEKKAKGKLVIYNAYSSESQVLVATTRFLSPSGKLFRLDERVTIPGAKIENGKIVPSKIEIRVTADEPGEDYNIGSEERWRIPGFKGDPRYEGFYADSREAMSGGFVGEEAVPTDEDLEAGRVKIFSDLESVLEAQALILLNEEFKVFPGAREFKILEERVEPAKSDGTFGIFAEAELRYLVFKEESIKEAVISDAGETVLPDMKVRDFSIDYGEPKINLAGASMTFSVEGQTVFEPDFDIEELKKQFAGQNEEELRKTVFFLSGLERANISLWPFWVSRVPSDPDKVKIILD
jgi:hypothetical protein